MFVSHARQTQARRKQVEVFPHVLALLVILETMEVHARAVSRANLNLPPDQLRVPLVVLVRITVEQRRTFTTTVLTVQLILSPWKRLTQSYSAYVYRDTFARGKSAAIVLREVTAQINSRKHSVMKEARQHPPVLLATLASVSLGLLEKEIIVPAAQWIIIAQAMPVR